MADDDELTLEPTDGKKKKRRQTPQEKLASSSATVRLEGLFQIEFEKRWGFAYVLNEARDRTLLKKLIDAWGEPATAAIIPEFFTTTDPQITRCRFYNVPDFSYWAPKLRMAQRGGDLHERTQANVHEITKAMGPRKP
jgi:hypothetical protein